MANGITGKRVQCAAVVGATSTTCHEIQNFIAVRLLFACVPKLKAQSDMATAALPSGEGEWGRGRPQQRRRDQRAAEGERGVESGGVGRWPKFDSMFCDAHVSCYHCRVTGAHQLQGLAAATARLLEQYQTVVQAPWSDELVRHACLHVSV